MKKYMVVEVVERDVIQIVPCVNLPSAVAKANALFMKWLENIKRLDEFESGDGEFNEWQKADEFNLCAWCNWSSNWDAHIVEAKDEVKSADEESKSSYLLYGECLIKNDESLEAFCHSLFENTVHDKDSSSEDILDNVEQQLTDDISRIDINYEALLRKYAAEIGPVLSEMDSRGCPMPEVHFYGPDAKHFFNIIVTRFIDYHLLPVLDESGEVKEWILERDDMA